MFCNYLCSIDLLIGALLFALGGAVKRLIFPNMEDSECVGAGGWALLGDCMMTHCFVAICKHRILYSVL